MSSRFEITDPLTDPDVIEVGIGELVVAAAPRRLYTPALGSCVGLALYDPFARTGGLAHIMLPNQSGAASSAGGMGRFADYAVPKLVQMLLDAGCLKRRMRAKLAGGAAMFRGDGTVVGIGGRNVAEVKRQLALMSIAIEAEDTGEAHARTVELVLQTGELLVKSYEYGVRKL